MLGDGASVRWTAGGHCLAVSSRKTHAHYRRAVPEPATVDRAYCIGGRAIYTRGMVSLRGVENRSLSHLAARRHGWIKTQEDR